LGRNVAKRVKKYCAPSQALATYQDGNEINMIDLLLQSN